MNPQQIITDAQAKLQQAVERFRDGLKGLRTGRASAAMLDDFDRHWDFGVASFLIKRHG